MAILAECPMCHKKQAVKNKKCVCGADLDKLKRQKEKVKYWNDYRIPIKDENGKTKYQQRREYIGYSIEDAKAASGKRKVQKKENRIFDMLPGTDLTFNELAEWYLNQEKVKEKRSSDRIRIGINRFNEVFGHRLVNELLPSELENYQVMRRKKVKPRTVDYELSVAGTMVNKAYYDSKISDAAFRAFKRVSNLLEMGSNARERVVSIEEYVRLVDAAADHIKPVIITAFNTGMRSGEIRKLRWEYVDLGKGMLRLPRTITKEKKDKSVPINHTVRAILNRLRPRKPKLKDGSYHDYVFTNNGAPLLDNASFRRSIESTVKRAGIDYGRKKTEGLCFHDIRATVKTNMLDRGIRKEYIDKILGHSLRGMDKFYIRIDDDKLKEAMDTYAAWLDTELEKITGTDTLVNTWSTTA